jgi:hypothetical protein
LRSASKQGRLKLTALALAGGVAVALFGCGSSNSATTATTAQADRQQVVDVIQAVSDAQASGDAAKFCELLTPSSQAALVTEINNVTHQDAASCADAAAPYIAGNKEAAQHGSVKVTDISVDGTSAQATSKATDSHGQGRGSSTTIYRLVKTSDGWKIDTAHGGGETTTTTITQQSER